MVSSNTPGLAENGVVELEGGNPNVEGEALNRFALVVKLVGPDGELPLVPPLPATLEIDVLRLLPALPLPPKLVPLNEDRSLISSCTVGGVGGLN